MAQSYRGSKIPFIYDMWSGQHDIEIYPWENTGGSTCLGGLTLFGRSGPIFLNLTEILVWVVNMRIVVLWSSGRVGGYLLPLLRSCEHEVFGLSRGEGDDLHADLTLLLSKKP